MKMTWLLFPIATLAMLSGCAEFVDRPLAPASTAAAFEARRLDDPGLRRFLAAGLKQRGRPPEVWDLETLTYAALYFHPDLDLARAQRELAEAGKITAAQRPNPSISLSPTYVTHNPIGLSPWLAGINPSIPIETAGKRDYRIAHAQHLAESARLKIAAAAWQVRSRLRASLVNLYAAERTAALRAEQRGHQEAWVRLLEERLAVGEISRPEVTLGHLALQQADLALREAERLAAEARVQLAEALGLPAAALAGVAVSFEALKHLPALESLPTDRLRRRAMLGRADILVALSDYEASQSALQLEIAKQYPDVNIGPGYIYNQAENRWVFGLNLSLPILHQNQGLIAEAEAHRKDAAARFEALQARVAGEVDRTWAGAASARHKLATAEDWLSAQARQRQSAEALFRAGETDRLALVSADLEYATTALARLDALVRAQQALGLLEDALQRPLDETGSLSPAAEPPPRRDPERP
jgi:cobalt-zinc-cadmium efflux system outer membrane protein